MADKNITTVNEISSVDDSDKVFVNDGNTLKQITVTNLMKKAPASSGGGTTDYNDLSNKPKLNGVTLEGNKTLDQVGVLAKNQGSNNSGKFLSVGSDGNVVPADAPSGGTVDPEQIKQAVNGYLEENPVSGMTAEQEQQLNQNTEDISSLSEEKLDKSMIKKYKWLPIGQMRNPVRNFQGWAHCIVFDPEIEKAVGIVMSGESSHSNQYPFYRVTIDENGYMSDYEEITFNYPESDNEEVGYLGSIMILDDGSYWCCDYRQRIFVSNDKGYTWNFKTQLQLGGRNSYNNDFLFGATKLSNGTYVAGNGGDTVAETYYSNDAYSWNVVKMDSSQLGSRVYPEGYYNPFEPFFIDCGDGKVIQYARASMNAYKSYSDGVWTQKEAAVYSVSEDYGVHWTPWKWSSGIPDMTANNGKVCVIGDDIHCVYGSRWIGYETDYGVKPFFALRYTHSNLVNAFSDVWENPEVIDVGHWSEEADRISDCGYPSIWKDSVNNLYAVYYDSDESDIPYGANWRLLIGNPFIQSNGIKNHGNGSKNVAYSQEQTEKLISSATAAIMEYIIDIYSKIDSIPPDIGGDINMPIMNGLINWWNYADYLDGTWTDKISEYQLNIQATIDNEKKMLDLSNMLTLPKISTLGNNFSIEFSIFMNTTGKILRNGTGMWEQDFELNQRSITTQNGTVETFFDDINSYPFVNKYRHVIVCYSKETGIWELYINGNKKIEVTDSSEFNNSYNLILFNQSHDEVGNIRIYNIILSEEEIKNNYMYESKVYNFT